MTRYAETAQKAQAVLDEIVASLPAMDPETKAHIISQTIYIYNLGIRTAPRGVQATVRLRAVSIVAQNQPVSIAMEQKQGNGHRGPYTYNALIIKSKGIESYEETSDSND